MPYRPELPDNTSVVDSIQTLVTKMTEANIQLADCIQHLASEKKKLDDLIAAPKTNENETYLIAAKKACKSSIKAWKMSIEAFRYDIEMYESEIDDVLKSNPEAAQTIDLLSKQIAIVH
jgi:hypothetical protein